MFTRTLARRMYIPRRKEVIIPGERVRQSRQFLAVFFSGALTLVCYFFAFGFVSLQRSPRLPPDSDIIKRRKGKKVVILGAGAGGACVASLLVNYSPDSHVTVIDKDHQYTLTSYAPLASVGHRSFDIRAGTVQTLQASTEWLVPKEANFVRAAVVSIDPKEQRVVDSKGGVHDYDYLVVATGAKPDVSAVKGLREEHLNQRGLATYCGYSRDFIISIYHGNCFIARVVPKEFYKRSCDNNFLAVATNVWKYLKFFGKLSSTHCTFKAFTGDQNPSDALPKEYNDELWSLYTERQMEVRTGMQLVEITPEKHVAVFQDVATKVKYALNYTYMYLDLPLKTSEPMASVFGANTGGFADVDHETLQHRKYPTVFALGDCAALPTIKSYAATFTQAPIVVHNILQHMTGYECNAKYDGYSSFALQMSTWRWMWPEVSYGGKRENYHIFDNTKWRDIRGFINAVVMQEMIYEMHFWFEGICGHLHPKHWYSYPSFELGGKRLVGEAPEEKGASA